MSHGGDIYKYAKILECSSDEIIDFSSNINCYETENKLTLTNKTITQYADFRYKELKTVISQNYNVKPSQIALYNGATTAIYELFRSIKQKRVFLYAPLYSEYEKAAQKTKKAVFKVSRLGGDMEDEVLEKSIVVFVNPATPDGTYYDEEELEELFSMWIEKECTIIIDESFLEFEALPSIRHKINEYKKLYIIQSFSKFYACAGVRIGAVFSSKKNIKKLEPSIWNISSLDVEFLKQRLNDEEFKTTSKEFHKKQKSELFEILENSGVFEQVFESDANFFLTKSERAAEIFNHLLEEKILTRRCFSFDYLDNTFLRFAVKDSAAHQKLRDALATLPQTVEVQTDELP
ncbi:aminotransferase class I/II-fold pyridoxal phosphate-dependent enzyme [Sulfurimonas marina]|uniref:histidinol-phosphate transaminase n=1 Tax=Sulfurimonas marina TaxID=2590551 RepID=A0A7M3V949_9BACT|nr:aminotransferase class I/II-fold pyridoxal phosphate-dependent enzyme [Sulfurimonas marina]QOP40282.1 aminotransferase class I/II-fold pyridoxal phosphate-dependent enzyme [Sulfurimonas marina]